MDEVIQSKITLLETENRIFAVWQEHVVANIQGSESSAKLGMDLHKEMVNSVNRELDSNYKFFYDKTDSKKRDILSLIVHKKAIWLSIEEKYAEVILQKKKGVAKDKLIEIIDELIEYIEGIKIYNKKLCELLRTL